MQKWLRGDNLQKRGRCGKWQHNIFSANPLLVYFLSVFVFNQAMQDARWLCFSVSGYSNASWHSPSVVCASYQKKKWIM